jgi:hypothetical protein
MNRGRPQPPLFWLRGLAVVFLHRIDVDLAAGLRQLHRLAVRGREAGLSQQYPFFGVADLKLSFFTTTPLITTFAVLPVGVVRATKPTLYQQLLNVMLAPFADEYV